MLGRILAIREHVPPSMICVSVLSDIEPTHRSPLRSMSLSGQAFCVLDQHPVRTVLCTCIQNRTKTLPQCLPFPSIAKCSFSLVSKILQLICRLLDDSKLIPK